MSGDVTVATAPTKMYRLPPIVDLPSKCPHSKSIYEMRNIHEDWRATEAEAKMPDDVLTQASLPEYEALEARQEKILSQLAELKKQVSKLYSFLRQSNQAEVKKDFVAVQVQKPVSLELVLNVNPSKPPYSILALQKLWKDTSFRVKSYIHSTINDQIPIVFPYTTKCATNTVELTLIWKDVSDMEVITDLRSTTIKGEVNFLRYVSRLIESHSYENTCLQPHTLDFALDFTNLLHKEQNIEKGLLKLAHEFEKWSCKGGFNIVDIAVWSLIKQFPGTILPLTLREWYDKCDKVFTEGKF
ncbi:hypothetical protein PUN28_004622 [Cardiocondyla obscurior]|uniref:AIMP2 thioredoxin-like domain-containing protein n=2 Tax=Cardiocondyla obscurior TaxID=286306 RepID=A0AAW2GEJ9_9HYME